MSRRESSFTEAITAAVGARASTQTGSERVQNFPSRALLLLWLPRKWTEERDGCWEGRHRLVVVWNAPTQVMTNFYRRTTCKWYTLGCSVLCTRLKVCERQLVSEKADHGPGQEELREGVLAVLFTSTAVKLRLLVSINEEGERKVRQNTKIHTQTHEFALWGQPATDVGH